MKGRGTDNPNPFSKGVAMASLQQLQQYLALWFQVGQGVVVNTNGQTYCPQPVLSQGKYSPEFQQCWQQLEQFGLENCYLDGTVLSLEELLNPTWEITACARCLMPIALPIGKLPNLACPCSDSPSWPNFDLPIPHALEGANAPLQRICDRIAAGDRRRELTQGIEYLSNERL